MIKISEEYQLIEVRDCDTEFIDLQCTKCSLLSDYDFDNEYIDTYSRINKNPFSYRTACRRCTSRPPKEIIDKANFIVKDL